MHFDQPLIPGRLLRRYKRFLADVELADGSQVTAHTPNTGSMQGCAEPGSRVWLRDSANLQRKYPLSWELVETLDGVMVGINTGLANQLVREAIQSGLIAELSGYAQIRSEVKYGKENSRIDLLLQSDGRPDCYVEVKNVTLVTDGIAYFPDAVSARGSKHLRELTSVVEQGARGLIFYCVQRGDARQVRPADHIDSLYGETLRQSLSAGVEALAFAASPSIEGIALTQSLPVIL
ncbi:MAG: DNA/RNA nuclease SfsA [Gammaproteobacteria bacterium]|nr:DNA/RNA nuclease SfsA [Gammaproteobacteria bacterium]